MESQISIQADKDYNVLVKKGVKDPDIRHEIQMETNVKAPVSVGQVVGKLSVYQGDRLVKEFELTSPVEVKKAGFWKLFKRTTGKLFHVVHARSRGRRHCVSRYGNTPRKRDRDP